MKCGKTIDHKEHRKEQTRPKEEAALGEFRDAKSREAKPCSQPLTKKSMHMKGYESIEDMVHLEILLSQQKDVVHSQ